MKKNYFLVFIAFLLFSQPKSFAQYIGGNMYLQGAYLEIGMLPNGSFGAPDAPAGYHPYDGGGGTNLAEVYDQGHDGWLVGTPPYRGDYTFPGSPFEGWELQINGLRNQAFSPSTVYPGTGTLTGSFAAPGAGYTNTGGVAKAVWIGTAGPGGILSVRQETLIDTTGSAFVVTTYFKNTSATVACPAVYYMRSMDPDDDEAHGGITYFSTSNHIAHQNEDVTHKVLVVAKGGFYPTDSTYLGLGTKDCRAKCFIYPTWPILTGVDLADAWTGSGPTFSMLGTTPPPQYTLNGYLNGDYAIALVFNLGTIGAGDSTSISYSYIFNGDSGIESPASLPDPQLVINGDTISNSIVNDSFNTCSVPGALTVPLGIIYGSDKGWSNGQWIWSPSTGLSATTGTSIIVNLALLSGPTTYTVTGSDSTSGVLNCNTAVRYFTILPCHSAYNNSPCIGDSLKLTDHGDSTGATYAWTGPGGYNSTLQDPFIYPSTYSDSGLYHVIKTIGSVHDTDSTYVIIHLLPVVTATNNGPLCTSPLGTLQLNSTSSFAGTTFSWAGPAGFTSGIQNPTIPSFGTADTGIYTVVATSPFGCVDSNTTDAGLIPPPPAPEIHGLSVYCEGVPFVPFIVTDSSSHNLDSITRWYVVATGGTSSTTPNVVNTAVPGTYTAYASIVVGSCESPRAMFTTIVHTTPAAPLVTGQFAYCQYIGPFAPLLVHTTATGTVNWYLAATGGTPGVTTEPIPDIDVVPTGGVYHYWVSQSDSGCEGPRQPVNITIHPKPSPPVVHPHPWCQFQTPSPVSATPSGTGDNLLWYGPGVTVGTTAAPTPSTVDAPDTITYYVTETTSFTCVSDSAVDNEIIIKKPAPPVTRDVYYCQHDHAIALSAEVDSAANSRLNWYYQAVALPGNPVPPTDTIPGVYTWYVSQTINTCESDSAAVNVTIIYKPVFSIAASQNYVCQFDSISLKYAGPTLVAPSYTWTFPQGIGFASFSHIYDDSVLLVFDSASIVNNVVTLTVSDDSGKCTSDTSISINIVPQPSAVASTRTDVCLGDTVLLALQAQTDNANTYAWYIDNVILQSSTALSIITANSNSGGPFSISWVDSGRHIIAITSYTQEGCKSLPWSDTINVHTIPDAHFHIISKNAGECIDDSVEFAADVADYNDSYVWTPANAFDNLNKPTQWGKVEEARSIITLTVTDPFGCTATDNLEVDPGSCCTVGFPNAFTPNGDTHDDYFRPLYSGYHKFHVFRVVNRWGQVVFNSENNDAQWDGNYNGVPQDMGTYYYYLKYDCGGKTMEAKGSLTLIR